MPIYSPGNNTLDMLLQKLAGYNRKVTALPSPASNPNGRLNYSGLDWYSDGTRWLTTQLYPLPLSFNPAGTVTSPLAATTPVALISGGPEDVSKLYVVKTVIRAVTNTTLDATNNWTLQLFRQDSAGTNVSLGTANTFQTGRVAGNSYLNTITSNTALAAVTDAYVFFITATTNAAPGTLTFSPGVMWYRLIG